MNEFCGLIKTIGGWAGDHPFESPEQLIKIVVREMAGNGRWNIGVIVDNNGLKQYISDYNTYNHNMPDMVVSLACVNDRSTHMFTSDWPLKLRAAKELLAKSQTSQEYEEREKEVKFWTAKSTQPYTKVIPPDEFWLGVSGWSQKGQFYGIIEGAACTAKINVEAISRDDPPKIIEIYDVQPASMEEILEGVRIVPECVLRDYFTRNFPRRVLARADAFDIVFEGVIFSDHEVTYNGDRITPKTTSIKKTTTIRCKNRVNLAREHRTAARIMVPFGASSAVAEYLRKLIEDEPICENPPVKYIAEMLTLTKILDFLGLVG